MPIRYRDGLIIALLIACPVRIKNLANLVIGQHLVFDGDAYRLKLSAAETKTGRPYLGSVPPELTPYIDGWLQVRRASLQLNAARKGQAGVGVTSGWIAPVGPCGARRSGSRLNLRTAFGKAICPTCFGIAL